MTAIEVYRTNNRNQNMGWSINTLDRLEGRTRYGLGIDDSEVAFKVQERIYELEEINNPANHDRGLVRQIMNGGVDAVSALLGERLGGTDAAERLPVANHMVSASVSLATKLGRVPDRKVDSPLGNNSDTARKAAEKRERIVANFDRASKLHMLLPQVGLWLPGYGFTPWVITHKRDPITNDPYPCVELRDPFTALPDEWSVNQQPKDIAFKYRMGVNKLKQYIGKEKAERLVAIAGEGQFSNDAQFGRHYDLSGIGGGNWSSQSGRGVPIHEYINEIGTWMIHADTASILSFVPNPLKYRAPFYVTKRFAFDKLVGQYDHIIGLMASIARLNLLLIIATEDSVHASTDIIGNVESNQGKYAFGRKAVNILSPNSQVAKSRDNVPFQLFQQGERLVEQLRIVAGYPQTEDSISPNSFVTGRGLEELQGSVNNRVREYYLSIGDTLQEVDSMQLEWEEELYPNREKTMWGVSRSAPFQDKYTPRIHIKGNYITRRVYGAMAAFDEPSKIITGLQLMSANIIDIVTMREQIDGLENHTMIEERLRWQQGEEMLKQLMMTYMQPGAEQMPPPNPKALKLLLSWLPPGQIRNDFEEFFLNEEEELDPMQQMMQIGMGAQPGLDAGAMDTQTVLSRLMSGQEPQAGIQTVGSI